MSPTKPVKRPIPKAGIEAVPETLATPDTAPIVAPATDASGVAELNVKMDKLLELAQAIDWKMWIYLKANNYID